MYFYKFCGIVKIKILARKKLTDTKIGLAEKTRVFCICGNRVLNKVGSGKQGLTVCTLVHLKSNVVSDNRSSLAQVWPSVEKNTDVLFLYFNFVMLPPHC